MRFVLIIVIVFIAGILLAVKGWKDGGKDDTPAL